MGDPKGRTVSSELPDSGDDTPHVFLSPADAHAQGWQVPTPGISHMSHHSHTPTSHTPLSRMSYMSNQDACHSPAAASGPLHATLHGPAWHQALVDASNASLAVLLGDELRALETEVEDPDGLLHVNGWDDVGEEERQLCRERDGGHSSPQQQQQQLAQAAGGNHVTAPSPAEEQGEPCIGTFQGDNNDLHCAMTGMREAAEGAASTPADGRGTSGQLDDAFEQQQISFVTAGATPAVTAVVQPPAEEPSELTARSFAFPAAGGSSDHNRRAPTPAFFQPTPFGDHPASAIPSPGSSQDAPAHPVVTAVTAVTAAAAAATVDQPFPGAGTSPEAHTCLPRAASASLVVLHTSPPATPPSHSSPPGLVPAQRAASFHPALLHSGPSKVPLPQLLLARHEMDHRRHRHSHHLSLGRAGSHQLSPEAAGLQSHQRRVHSISGGALQNTGRADGPVSDLVGELPTHFSHHHAVCQANQQAAAAGYPISQACSHDLSSHVMSMHSHAPSHATDPFARHSYTTATSEAPSDWLPHVILKEGGTSEDASLKAKLHAAMKPLSSR